MIDEYKIKNDLIHGFEIFNTKDINLIGSWYDEILAPDCVYHNPNMPDVIGRENIKRFVSDLYKNLPDLYHNAPEDIIVQRDKVAVRHTVNCTDPVSGKRQTMMIVFIDRYSNGKIIEEWELVVTCMDQA
jgi:predicted ester cyclase